MAEWDIVLVISTLIGLVGAFAGVAWKFGMMISKLEGLIDNLDKTITDMKEDQMRDREEVRKRLDDHDTRIRITETAIVELKAVKESYALKNE